MQEDPEIQDFKSAVADTAEDAKKSVQSTDTKSTGSEKTVLEQVQMQGCSSSATAVMSVLSLIWSASVLQGLYDPLLYISSGICNMQLSI